jgi:predicted transcriptional regulator
MSETEIQRIKGLVTSLTHPDRAEIIKLVSFAPQSNKQIFKNADKAEDWTRRQINALVDGRLILKEKEGRKVIYTLNRPYMAEITKTFQSLLKIMDNESK